MTAAAAAANHHQQTVAKLWTSAQQREKWESKREVRQQCGDREGESESESEKGKTTPELRNVQTELLEITALD